ncbi:cyclic nucleotide-binding domain-containing protein [candidate division KSB1 bacterium]
MEVILDILKDHAFFKNIEPDYLARIAECSSDVQYAAGEFIFREGEEARNVNIIRQGKVAIELYVPRQGIITLETIGRGEILGWSWFTPPYRRQFDSQAIELTRAISIDAECLRKLCDDESPIGYVLMKHFATVIVERLQATRLQLLDMYRLH